jgi:hypothetical protein
MKTNMPPHDIIQKNMESFDEKFDPCDIIDDRINPPYLSFPLCKESSEGNMLYEIKSHLLSSQLSIIQAIDEMIDEVIKNKEQVNGFQPYHTCDEECEVHCKKERDEKKIFFDGFDDGRNMMKIDLMKIRSFLKEAKTKLQ